jgi:poly-gamma-glutamate synthesis protein (capsule biosynthesis protein)
MEAEFIFCGDTMLGATRLKSNPFAGVQALLSRADIAFCNLETSLAGEGPAAAKRHVISSAPENLEFLAEAGFGAVNVANNHILDRGEAACLKLIELVKSKGIQVVGLRSQGFAASARSAQAAPVLLMRKGVRIGLLGYADYGFRGTALMPLRERIALTDVAKLRCQTDCVIVSLHWGYEYTEWPSPAQQRFARTLIDAGANIIIGHHSHVAQGIEEYNGGLIAYSLGNFQFCIAMGDRFLNTGSGIMLRVRRSSQGRISYEVIPTKVSASGEVELIPVEGHAAVLDRLTELSASLRQERISRLKWMRDASRLWLPVSLESWFFKIEKFGSMQWLEMLRWLLKPEAFCCFVLYLFGPKHPSSRRLFRRD